jgi:hypothetical protein
MALTYIKSTVHYLFRADRRSVLQYENGGAGDIKSLVNSHLKEHCSSTQMVKGRVFRNDALDSYKNGWTDQPTTYSLARGKLGAEPRCRDPRIT